jgi:integrase
MAGVLRPGGDEMPRDRTQRRGEITAARWEHFDLDSAIWSIPAELSKNGKEHKVPLSPLAVQILNQLREVTGERPCVLASQHSEKKPDKPYSERVLSRAVRENADHWEIPHFTPHDLRRTAASMMTAIGVPRLHVEKVLNHTLSDIAEVYDRHDYFEEKKITLNRWANHLKAVIANKKPKVVPLHSQHVKPEHNGGREAANG